MIDMKKSKVRHIYFAYLLKFLAGYINPDIIKYELILYKVHKRFILIYLP